VRVFLTATLAAAVLAGCGSAPRPNEPPQRVGTIAGFTRYSVPSAGFSLAVPKSWRAMTADQAFGPRRKALDQLINENTDIAQFRDIFERPDTPIKLVAVHPEADTGRATSLNVLVMKAPGDGSFEDFIHASEGDLDQIKRETRGFKRVVVSLPAGKAQRISYLASYRYSGRLLLVETVQYGLVADGRSFILTYATPNGLAHEHAGDFQRSARSFRSL
jgi:hypothetical protein